MAERFLAGRAPDLGPVARADEFAGGGPATRSRSRSTPHWTPVPIVGYRAWRVYRNGLRGSRAWWPGPVHEARCRVDPSSPRLVPHDDGRCGRLGCGVYALADPGDVRSVLGTASPVVLGAVALTGKVVEHEAGYRAARAEVVAAAVLHRTRPVASTDRGWLVRLFLDPVAAIGEHGRDLRGDPIDYLTDAARRYEERWTSANRSG